MIAQPWNLPLNQAPRETPLFPRQSTACGSAFCRRSRSGSRVIQVAADALAAGTLIASRREAAFEAAHKLAGVLGTFGLTRGTVLARELEINFSRGDGPDPASGKRLAAIAAELRAMVESRK